MWCARGFWNCTRGAGYALWTKTYLCFVGFPGIGGRRTALSSSQYKKFCGSCTLIFFSHRNPETSWDRECCTGPDEQHQHDLLSVKPPPLPLETKPVGHFYQSWPSFCLYISHVFWQVGRQFQPWEIRNWALLETIIKTVHSNHVNDYYYITNIITWASQVHYWSTSWIN